MGITANNALPRLLDLTRLVSRAGRPLTGVDRVEHAYLTHLLQAGPLFGLVRTSLGYVLLDTAGCKALLHRLNHGGWGPADRLSRLKRRMDPLRARAEADLRRLCLGRCLPFGLARLLRRHLPQGAQYLNTGHSNLTDRVLQAVRALPHNRIAVLIHDTIPLDHPEFQRPGTIEVFRAFLTRAARHADLLICNSAQTERDLLRHVAPVSPKTVVAHLGVDMPSPGIPPNGPWTGQTYFVCLGTIEPRKNHALLLDLWDKIPDAHLLICGSRGWENHTVFARLDTHPPRVHELPGLGDAAVFGLLQNAAGLLFPSHAEGYGLPPIEAAALGVPVLCSDLAIFREVLEEFPVYAAVSDSYLWETIIKRMAKEHQTVSNSASMGAQVFTPPSWDAHFNAVLRMI